MQIFVRHSASDGGNGIAGCGARAETDDHAVFDQHRGGIARFFLPLILLRKSHRSVQREVCNEAHHSRRRASCQLALNVYMGAASFESGFRFRDGVSSVLESQGVYVHGSAKGAVNIGDGDKGESEQQ
jgi:hypothetical protein